MLTILLTVLSVLGLAAAVGAWIIRVIKADEVAISDMFGYLGHRTWEGGVAFLPRLPWVWLIRWSTHIIRLSYDPSDWGEKYKFFTKDGIQVHPRVTFCLEFPYLEADSLKRTYMSGVPRTEKELKIWAEALLFKALFAVLQRKNHGELIGGSFDAGVFAEEVRDILYSENGTLNQSGILGRNRNDRKPGTGRGFVEVEQLEVSEEVQKAMAAPVVADYEARAAEALAERDAHRIGGPLKKLMDAWVVDMAQTTGRSAKEITESPEYQQQLRAYKDLILAAGDNLAVNRIEVGDPTGKRLEGDLGAGVAFAGALAGIFGRGGVGGSRGNSGGQHPHRSSRRPRKVGDMTDEELDDAADED